MFELPRLTLARGVSLALSTAFAFGRLAFGVRLALAGLFAFAFHCRWYCRLCFRWCFCSWWLGLVFVCVARVAIGVSISVSTGLTVSEASPSPSTNVHCHSLTSFDDFPRSRKLEQHGIWIGLIARSRCTNAEVQVRIGQDLLSLKSIFADDIWNLYFRLAATDKQS